MKKAGIPGGHGGLKFSFGMYPHLSTISTEVIRVFKRVQHWSPVFTVQNSVLRHFAYMLQIIKWISRHSNFHTGNQGGILWNCFHIWQFCASCFKSSAKGNWQWRTTLSQKNYLYNTTNLNIFWVITLPRSCFCIALWWNVTWHITKWWYWTHG